MYPPDEHDALIVAIQAAALREARLEMESQLVGSRRDGKTRRGRAQSSRTGTDFHVSVDIEIDSLDSCSSLPGFQRNVR